MAELREELQTIGLDGVETYINSGNIFFESAASKAELVDLLGHFFREHYPFIQSFLSFFEDYARDLAALPAWWQEGLARKDVLFYTAALIRMLSGSWSPLFRSVMKSSIVEALGFYWGEIFQKRPIQRQPTTDKSLRCRITV